MRIKKIWLTIILICCSILFFAACMEERLAESVSLNGYSSETPLEFTMGNFSYNNYTVSVTYNDGATEEIALAEDMISETDKLKFYQEGRNSITLTYKGAETSIEINVSRNQFSDNIQLNDFTATYNGTPFTVEVEGDIPGGTKILYPQGNTFQNAGSYDMTAILQCDGYASKILSARVMIEKAVYDVTNAQLYNETVVYNRETHNLAVKGTIIESNGAIVHSPATLPQGVSVSYSITKVQNGKGEDIATDKQQFVEGNKAVEAGTYKVCAHFKGDISNYNAIPDSVAYLTINRATYDMSKIEFVDKTVTYSGEAYTLSIAKNSKLPTDVEVSYQTKRLEDGDGNQLNDASYQTGNQATEVGVYLVEAKFSIIGKNAENYITEPFEKQAYLTILRASYDEELQNVYLDTQWEEFVEDKTYEIYFECELPQGVTPQFTLTSDSGEIIQGTMETVTSEVEGDETATKTTYKYSFSVERAGEYICVVTFVHDNENYDTITLELNATFYISNVV